MACSVLIIGQGKPVTEQIGGGNKNPIKAAVEQEITPCEFNPVQTGII